MINWDVTVVIYAIVTIFCFTFIIGETPLYRLVEYLFIGLAGGTLIEGVYKNLLDTVWTAGVLRGNYSNVATFAFSLLLLTRFFTPKIRWLGRWPVALYMGSLVGVSITSVVNMLYQNMTGTMELGRTILTGIGPIVFIIGVMTSLSYFIFTRKHTGALGITSKIGRYFILSVFGALWGSTVFERLTLLLSAIKPIVWGWLGLG